LEQFEEDFPQLKSHLVQNICGDFVSHIDMLSTLTHAIVNNAANTFGARSVNFKKGRKCLNAYLVELACKAKINFVLATFEALPELESPPLNQCFERSQHLSGGIGFDGVTEWVSWSPKKPQYIFVYKKVNAGWKCHCDFVNAVVNEIEAAAIGRLVEVVVFAAEKASPAAAEPAAAPGNNKGHSFWPVSVAFFAASANLASRFALFLLWRVGRVGKGFVFSIFWSVCVLRFAVGAESFEPGMRKKS
jgi:hypothetical protein